MIQLIYMGLSAARSGFLLYILLRILRRAGSEDKKSVCGSPEAHES